MHIRLYGDPFLRKIAKPVEKIGPDQKKALEDMAKAMYKAKGVGLAATQVGIDQQLIVIDIGKGLLKLANPVLVKAECSKFGEEGCLSFPEITVKIKRPEKVVVEALNQEGAKIKIDADGMLARALQHEMDHLKGVVIIDKIGIRQRFLIAGKLKRLKKKFGG